MLTDVGELKTVLGVLSALHFLERNSRVGLIDFPFENVFMRVLPLCLHHVRAWCLPRPEEGVGSPETNYT